MRFTQGNLCWGWLKKKKMMMKFFLLSRLLLPFSATFCNFNSLATTAVMESEFSIFVCLFLTLFQVTLDY
jgi:hypothetical protein